MTKATFSALLTLLFPSVLSVPKGECRGSTGSPRTVLGYRTLQGCLIAAVAFSMGQPVFAKDKQTASEQTSPPAYTLQDLRALAMAQSQAFEAIRDQVEIARAGVTTAKAFPNPSLELVSSRSSPRTATATGSNSRSQTLVQPLDLPNRRWARVDAAEAAAEAAEAQGAGSLLDLMTRLQQAFYAVLRYEQELKSNREDAALITGIRNRIAKRVEVGDAARFELIRAEAELLNAEKSAHSTDLKLQQARGFLQQLVGQNLPDNFSLEGRLEAVTPPPPQDAVRDEILKNNPLLRQARAEGRQAESNLDFAQAQRWPDVALEGGREQDPELKTNWVGVVVTIPLWDWKTGPVAEARANAARARHQLSALEFSVQRDITIAYQSLEIAHARVEALSGGIVRQAEEALKIAETAYRFGERGFMDVLDAGRVLRAARNELIAARYDFAAACAEIERLRGEQGAETP